MEYVREVLDWIAARETLLSGAAALIVLLGVVISGVSVAHRLLRRVPGTAQGNGKRITLRELSTPAPYPIRFAHSDGLRIAYAVQGKGPPDVLLAPGIISHLHITSHLPPLRNTVRALTRYARVVTFDKRGQGLSDPCLEVPDLEQRVHDIEAVMDAAGMDCPILFGLSEGGPMCIRFARDHPDRVRGLILLGSTARWLQGENFPIGIPERALDSLAESWGTGVLRHVFFPGIGADVLDDDTYRGFEKLIAPRQSVRQLVEYLKTVDVTADLAALRCPTLVLHFSGDLAVPVRLGRAMAESVPNARFVELTGTDHADLTQSTTAVKVVREFIQSL